MAPERRRPTRPPRGQQRDQRRPAAATSWDPLAAWYNGWVGQSGSEHHRRLAVPAVLEMLAPSPQDRILDIGCGQGVLAPAIQRAGAEYVGVDASPRLIELGRQMHGNTGTFLVGDARKLGDIPELRGTRFTAAVYLLSLQDMDPMPPVIQSTVSLLAERARVVLLLTHPAFRIPRQSGWGWDEGRKLVYRRVDRYLTPLPVPLKTLPGKDSRATTRSFHRPLQDYINTLGANGLYTDRILEIPGYKLSTGSESTRADELARTEIPLFLALRAVRIPDGARANPRAGAASAATD